MGTKPAESHSVAPDDNGAKHGRHQSATAGAGMSEPLVANAVSAAEAAAVLGFNLLMNRSHNLTACLITGDFPVSLMNENCDRSTAVHTAMNLLVQFKYLFGRDQLLALHRDNKLVMRHIVTC